MIQVNILLLDTYCLKENILMAGKETKTGERDSIDRASVVMYSQDLLNVLSVLHSILRVFL